MIGDEGCPLCGQKEKCRINSRDYYTEFHCQTYNRQFLLHTSIFDIPDNETRERVLDLVVEHLLANLKCTYDGTTHDWYFHFYPKEYTENPNPPHFVEMSKQLAGYPKTLQEKADRVLLNLCIQYPNYDDSFCIMWRERRLIFQHTSNNQQTGGILKLMCEMGFLTESNPYVYTISAKGWQRIYELQQHNNERKQGFVAMAFRDDTKPIREAIRKGIANAGYAVSIIDEKEHNNQIVPEIFYEIDHSQFLVIDVSVPNYGAYYEAGYALGKGKEVIACCRKDAFSDSNTRPHFDIAQKSMII